MPEKPQRNTIAYLALCTIAALAAIVWGALFLIAPVWQFSGTMPSYVSQRDALAVSASESTADLEANQEEFEPDR